jgi:glutathione S-transferase
MSTLIVHGGLPSPFVRKTLICLEEKRIPYELRPLSPFPKTLELLAMNPFGRIPILQDGDFMLPDSSAIALYLEKTHPSPALGRPGRALRRRRYHRPDLHSGHAREPRRPGAGFPR